MQFEWQQYVIFILLALFIIEQPFYWILGSYIYRHGISIKSISINGADWSKLSKIKSSQLSIKFNNNKSEIYIRYKCKYIIGGSILLFICIIKICNLPTISIRVGPLTFLFLIYLIVFPTLLSGLKGIFGTVVICAFLYFMHNRIYRNIKSALEGVGIRFAAGKLV